MRIKATIDEFREWLEKRGYKERMGEEGFETFLNTGFPSLFFANSALLYAFIYTKLGVPSERINERIRFELAKRITAIFVERDYLEIEFA
uniref:Uncharacterized protein n=1 Tax=Geoglobus ahangari TaxID=113653 RepID=A0A7C3UIP4_9EURY